jgi:hypothetical protein
LDELNLLKQQPKAALKPPPEPKPKTPTIKKVAKKTSATPKVANARRRIEELREMRELQDSWMDPDFDYLPDYL